MTQSQPTSTGHSSSDSNTIGLSTDQTPMTNAATILNESESNPAYGRKGGDIKYLFDKVRDLKTIDNLDFADRLALSDIIHEAWTCGFKDRLL